MKQLSEYTGEELAEVLSGEMQKIMQSYGDITNSTNVLHMVQNELERRKLEKAGHVVS